MCLDQKVTAAARRSACDRRWWLSRQAPGRFLGGPRRIGRKHATSPLSRNRGISLAVSLGGFRQHHGNLGVVHTVKLSLGTAAVSFSISAGLGITAARLIACEAGPYC
jgi:hypothetical protein